MISGTRNEPPISTSSPRDTIADRPRARPASTSSTAAALLFTTSAAPRGGAGRRARRGAEPLPLGFQPLARGLAERPEREMGRLRLEPAHEPIDRRKSSAGVSLDLSARIHDSVTQIFRAVLRVY